MGSYAVSKNYDAVRSRLDLYVVISYMVSPSFQLVKLLKLDSLESGRQYLC
jgi:hypothetical protein